MEAIHLYELINFIRFVCLLDCEIAIQLISVEKNWFLFIIWQLGKKIYAKMVDDTTITFNVVIV